MTRSRRRTLQRLAASRAQQCLVLEGRDGRRAAGAAAPRRPNVALAQQGRPAASRRSSSPPRSARRTCRRCRSASRPSARSGSTQLQINDVHRLREVPAERLLHLRRAGLQPRVLPRRRERREQQPLGPVAERRHLPRRAADHDDPGLARRPPLRRRARRGARRTAGHAVRRELAGGHDPHHHQPARPDAASRPATASKATTVEHGDPGYLAEGFVNLPISAAAAVRLVGWARHDAGYIDNVPATRTFPTSGGCIIERRRRRRAGCERTPVRAKDDYNDVDTYGARAALRVDLNDNWTITPSIMAQNQDANGSFAYDPAVGDLKMHTYYPSLQRGRVGPGGADRRGQDRQLRRRLRGRLPESRRRASMPTTPTTRSSTTQ